MRNQVPSRSDVAAYVFRRLGRDRAFRDHFPAVAADGTRPVIVAVLDDPLHDVIRQVDVAGGEANVVVPILNGFLIIAMRPAGADDPCTELAPTCTVGLFIQRLQLDAPSTSYCLGAAGSPTHQDHEAGRAELVALAERS